MIQTFSMNDNTEASEDVLRSFVYKFKTSLYLF